MNLRRLRLLPLFAALLALASGFLIAAPQTVRAQEGTQFEADESAARNRGVVQGEILSVDYARGMLDLQTRRGRVTIALTPGTGIMRGDHQYATVADLVPHARVSVYVSEINGRLVAQLIRIQ